MVEDRRKKNNLNYLKVCYSTKKSKLTVPMRSYTLAEACNQQEEIFEQASLELVVLTTRSQPSHVIMSFDTYQHLIERLTELEDIAWVK